MHEILGDGFYMKSQYDSAMYHFLRAEEYFKNYGSEYDLAWNHNYQGNVYMELGNTSEAVAHFSAAEEYFEKVGDDPWGYSTILYNYCNLYLQQGNIETGFAIAKTAMNMILKSDSFGLPGIYGIMSEFQAELGQLDSAIYYAKTGLAINKELNTGLLDKAVLLNDLAYNYHLLGKHEMSLIYADSGLTVNRKLGDKAGIAYSFLGRGLALNELEEVHMAEIALDSAWHYALLNKSPSLIGYLIDEEVDFHRTRGNWEKALSMSDSLNSYTDRIRSTPLKESFLEAELKRKSAQLAALSERENFVSTRLQRG